MRLLTMLGLVLASVVSGSATAPAVEPGPAANSSWRFAQAMSQRRSYTASAQLGARIYIAGGMVGNNGRSLALFQRYDPDRDAWTTLAPLPEPVRAAAAGSLARRVYVVGGQTPTGVSSRVWAYDPLRGSWSPRTPLPQPLFNHAATVVRGRLYVLGGLRRTRQSRAVYSYDARRDSWQTERPLPHPLYAGTAVAYRGKLWTIGGRRGERTLREVWIYDPRAKTWRAGPALPDPMELLGAAAAGREIHAVWESSYRVYVDGAWHSGPVPLVPRHALAALAVGGRLYTIGGCRSPELEDSQIVEVRTI